jgi:hypothetical protein
VAAGGDGGSGGREGPGGESGAAGGGGTGIGWVKELDGGVGVDGHAANAADRRAGTVPKRGLGVRGIAPGKLDRPEQSDGWIGKALRPSLRGVPVQGSWLPFPARMERAIKGMDGSTWDAFEAQALLPPARGFCGVVVSVACVVIDHIFPRHCRCRGRDGLGGVGQQCFLVL